ncbi:hypothetical protein AE937_13205 [Bacteroides fragilis]|uniref:Uncharacterized protein n=1 Tax=Bacteroides fragilis TaxID=817 RepID=A0A413JRW7_BACFG|nr:hypothetical protein [Bacteroides fragilis]RGY63713.1 hypothetical protein DXA27_22785 [Bacteroides fragilis]
MTVRLSCQHRFRINQENHLSLDAKRISATHSVNLNGCKDAVIENTVFEGNVPGQNVKTENMKRNDLKSTIK